MNGLSKISNLPATQSGLSDLKNDIINYLTSGEAEVTEFVVFSNNIKKMLDSISKNEQVKNELNRELDLNDKTFSVGEFEVMQTGKKTYDFSACNDAKYNEAKQYVKDREKFFKTLKEPVADVETGEIISPPSTKTSSYIKVTPKKLY